MQQHIEAAKGAADAFSITIAVATLLGYLPQIAALLTIVWTGMRIVQDFDKFKATIVNWFKKKDF